KPSLAWRAENLSKRAQKKGAKFGDKTVKFAEDLGDDAAQAMKSWEKEAKKSFRKAELHAKRAAAQMSREAHKAKPYSRRRLTCLKTLCSPGLPPRRGGRSAQKSVYLPPSH